MSAAWVPLAAPAPGDSPLLTHGVQLHGTSFRVQTHFSSHIYHSTFARQRGAEARAPLLMLFVTVTVSVAVTISSYSYSYFTMTSTVPLPTITSSYSYSASYHYCCHYYCY